MEHPEVIAAIDEVKKEAGAIGKNCGMVVGSVEQASFWINRGFSFFICSEISGIVRHRSKELVKEIHDAHSKVAKKQS